MSNLRTEHEIEIDRIHDRQLADKDAEIERLKEENAHLAWRDKDQKQLITELCDALEKANPTDRYRKLLQRAREETK